MTNSLATFLKYGRGITCSLICSVPQVSHRVVDLLHFEGVILHDSTDIKRIRLIRPVENSNIITYPVPLHTSRDQHLPYQPSSQRPSVGRIKGEEAHLDFYELISISFGDPFVFSLIFFQCSELLLHRSDFPSKSRILPTKPLLRHRGIEKITYKTRLTALSRLFSFSFASAHLASNCRFALPAPSRSRPATCLSTPAISLFTFRNLAFSRRLAWTAPLASISFSTARVSSWSLSTVCWPSLTLTSASSTCCVHSWSFLARRWRS